MDREHEDAKKRICPRCGGRKRRDHRLCRGCGQEERVERHGRAAVCPRCGRPKPPALPTCRTCESKRRARREDPGDEAGP